jgi:hypothetical protein
MDSNAPLSHQLYIFVLVALLVSATVLELDYLFALMATLLVVKQLGRIARAIREK